MDLGDQPKNIVPIKTLLKRALDELYKTRNRRLSETGLLTGFAGIDEKLYGFGWNDLVVLAARPTMGKTSLAVGVARNVALDFHLSVMIFSLQLSAEQYVMRMLSAGSKIDGCQMRNGHLSPSEWERIFAAAEVLEKGPIFIDDTPGIRLSEIFQKARSLKNENGLDLIIIDDVQLIDYASKFNAFKIFRQLKSLAKTINVPILALSNLSSRIEDRKDKRPVIEDITKSKGALACVDQFLLLYRDDVYNPLCGNDLDTSEAELIIVDKASGHSETCCLSFRKKFACFEDRYHQCDTNR